MLRGVAKTIETPPRTVRYSFNRADLIKRLRLPEDSVVAVGDIIVGEHELGAITLNVEFVLAPKTKAAK